MRYKFFGFGDVVESVKDTKTFEEADKNTALIVRAINAALSPLEIWVLGKEYNVAKTKKLLEKRLEGISPENIITPPSYIGVPVLQAISYCMNDDQLCNMYAELLANAMNCDCVDNVHPTYVEIIKQMSPFDAVVFQKLLKTLVRPAIGISYQNRRTKASYPVQDIVAFTDLEKYPLVPTQISLENLERLKLIEINRSARYGNDEMYERLKQSVKYVVDTFISDNEKVFDKNAYEMVYKEYVIMIRGFGQYFARACMGADFSDIS